MNKIKSSRVPAKGALLAAVMIPVAAVHAQVITFPLDGAEGAPSSINETVSGVTLHYFNPTGASGFHPANLPIFFAAPSGFNGFQFQFNAPVQVTSYTLGSSSGDPTGATFDLNGPNGASLDNTLAAGAGTQPINGSYILQTNEIGTLTTTFFFSSTVQFNSITVAVVPEPAAWAGIAGLGGLLLAWGRRRISSQATVEPSA